jgi:hypothetical protein
LKLDYTADRGQFSLVLAHQEDTEDSHIGFFGSWNLNDALVLYTEESLREGELEALLGGSYTFSNGSMLTIEYFYNGAGNSDDEPLEVLATGGGPSDRLLLSRKHYMLLQYYYRDMLDRWNAMLRGTSNLDDQSAALLGLVEFNIGSHVQLFASGTLFAGDETDEFGLLLDYRAMAGVEIVF